MISRRMSPCSPGTQRSARRLHRSRSPCGGSTTFACNGRRMLVSTDPLVNLVVDLYFVDGDRRPDRFGLCSPRFGVLLFWFLPERLAEARHAMSPVWLESM
jgi:hypothetical protein